jgi:hypothetical protein
VFYATLARLPALQKFMFFPGVPGGAEFLPD